MLGSGYLLLWILEIRDSRYMTFVNRQSIKLWVINPLIVELPTELRRESAETENLITK